MRQCRLLLAAFVCLASVQLWAAGSPTVYVSTTAGTIYAINTASGTATLLVSTPGADYEGMVVAPDDASGTSHPFLVYACDTANNKIVRFDPAVATPITPEVIYSGGALQHPQCGRITSTGDLVVTSRDTGADAGLWVFPGVAGVELGSGSGQIPAQALAASGSSGAGLAQKNIGDILMVDNANNQVLRAPFPAYNTSNAFITGLSQPVGIARGSAGDLFIVNQGSRALTHFNAQGQNPTTCQTFKQKDVPFFAQMSLDNTLYIAISGNIGGSVRAVNANTCQAIQTFQVPSPAVGVALPPTSVTQNVTASNGAALVNFGFTAFEINQISGPCGGTLTVSLASPLTVSGLIENNSGLPAGSGNPAVNLGLDGFESVISTANLNGCTAADGKTLNFQVAADFAPNVINPQLLVCDDANVDCQPITVNLSPIGVWPIGGYLPQDAIVGADKSLRCNVFLMNSNPTNQAGQEPGTFCGFQNPVANTFFNGQQNPGAATSFSDGKSVPVKFKLAAGLNNSCQSAPFITDAIALLSVAQIADSKGNPTFVPIGLISNGSSGLAQPVFKIDSNQQYLFNWDTGSCIMPSGVTQLCPKGRYSLTVVFDTFNTSGSQSVYTVQTTEIVLK